MGRGLQGDGTTSVVLFTGELLAQAARFIDEVNMCYAHLFVRSHPSPSLLLHASLYLALSFRDCIHVLLRTASNWPGHTL